jgi:hypothetical protein
MNDDTLLAVSINDSFSFNCHSKIPCFNECCRDLNQFLTPYDVLRIRQFLNLSSPDFLEQYCGQHTGPESGLPVVTLKPVDPESLVCPFLSPAGCRIYESRPSSCRMYPLMRAVSRSRETGQVMEHYALLREPHCLGHVQAGKTTVSRWIQSQGLLPYNEMNDKILDIISLKNQARPGPLDLTTSRFCAMALYDLDTFRRNIFKNSLLRGLDMDSDALELARTDDLALLALGMEAVKQVLLAEPPVK